MELKDQLSWSEFHKQSKDEPIIDLVKPFNRLIAHSKNLFVVAGYGSFTEGYMLVITKDFMPSFGLVENEIMDELNFLIKLIKYYHKKKFERNTVIFEHGMCACIGGLDRAHLHLMSIDNESSEKSLTQAIDQILYKRKAGIKHIKFGNHKLENIHDINQFMDDNDNLDYEVVGKLFKIEDIKNLNYENWPLITLNHINKGGHYVYFKSDFKNSSFLTTHNFQTQFGRQVVYQNELALSKKFSSIIKKIKKKNPLIEPWRWQSCMFEENIIKTVNQTRKEFKNYKLEFPLDYEKFNINIL